MHHSVGADSRALLNVFEGGRAPGGNLELHRWAGWGWVRVWRRQGRRAWLECKRAPDGNLELRR